MRPRAPNAVAAILSIAVAVGCADAPTPPASMTPRADPRGDLTVGLTAPSPTDLGLLLAGVADARGRILPTLPSSPALAALDTQLGRLEAALSTGELPTAGSAVDQARSALGDLAGAGEVAPAEVGAIELALDRVMRVVRPSAP